MDAASGQGNGTRSEPPSSQFQKIWRADLVCPAEGPPIHGGAVLTPDQELAARIRGIGRGDDEKAVLAQILAQKLAQADVVVDDQDMG